MFLYLNTIRIKTIYILALDTGHVMNLLRVTHLSLYSTSIALWLMWGKRSNAVNKILEFSWAGDMGIRKKWKSQG